MYRTLFPFSNTPSSNKKETKQKRTPNTVAEKSDSSAYEALIASLSKLSPKELHEHISRLLMTTIPYTVANTVQGGSVNAPLAGMVPLYSHPLFYGKSRESTSLRMQYSKVFSKCDVMRDNIVRDFLDYWYRPYVSGDDNKFLGHIRLVLDAAFNILIKRVTALNWTTFLSDRILIPLRDLLYVYKGCLEEQLVNDPLFHHLSEKEQLR